VKFSHISEHILGSGHDDGTVAVWDVNKSQILTKFEGKHIDACRGVVFSPVNNMLMGSAGLDKKVIFYDIFKNKKVVEDINLAEPCTSVSFN